MEKALIAKTNKTLIIAMELLQTTERPVALAFSTSDYASCDCALALIY